jgi:hypothetical protein
MKVKLPLLVLLLCISVLVKAQSARVSGRIVDNTTQKTLPGVGIIVINAADTTQRNLTTTDINGDFFVTGLPTNRTFILRTSYIGYAQMGKSFSTKNPNVSLGTLALIPKSTVLDEVVVEGQKTPVVQKGDTTEMSASAYKVNVDANAQDLVQKMPGVTLENGTVKAHGEEIKRVLVDGKNFFGEDASMALQNLPAEVIDKVQIYNKMSDQAEFTGFDDGNSSKVLNIITRADRRRGENGTITGGTDFVDKYQVSGRLNVFRGTKKITLTGGANNINQQPFSTQDILGVMGGGGVGGGRRGGGPGFIGRQSGLNKPASIGLNYTNAISKKLTISGSYFFNKQDNLTKTISSTINRNMTDTLGKIGTPRFNQNPWDQSTNVNFNHRFDMKVEYTIDTANSIIWSPRFSTQDNNSGSFSDTYGFNLTPDTVLHNLSNSSSSGLGYNYTSDLTFRHKFAKKGRTISVGTTISGNLNRSDQLKYSFIRQADTIGSFIIPAGYTIPSGLPYTDSVVDLRTHSKTKGTTFSSNLAYTEPIGTSSLIQLGYNASFSWNNTDREAYDRTTDLFLDKYSNVYNSSYNTQRGGITYLLRKGDKLMANAGVDYQFALLNGERTYPGKATVDRTFENVLPNAMMNYKFSKNTNLRIFYRTSTNPPSVTQLQDVVTIINSRNISMGNSLLEHEYTNNGALNYRYSNPEKFTNFGFNLFGNYTNNAIGNAIYEIRRDTIIDTVKYTGVTLTKPQNFKSSWNTRLFVNYGFLFMPIKCNLNVIGGIGFSQTPGSKNYILNRTNQYNITGGLVIASNISKNADFTVSYTGNYTISDVIYDRHNQEFIGLNTSNTHSAIWNHSLTLTSTFTIWERLILQNTLNEQLNAGLGSGYDQNYLLWNTTIGFKVFKNKAGQIKLSIFDVLKQNRSISQSVTAYNTVNSSTNTLQRFMLFSFTYTLRNYSSSGEDRHRDGFGPGPGPGFGPPPGGGRPF